MVDLTKTSDPNAPVDLTLGELRRLRARVKSHYDDAQSEMDRLGEGRRAIESRLRHLIADQNAQSVLLSKLDRTIGLAEDLPRGRRVVLTAPWTFPRYNPHRRIAVMERSFL